MDEKRYQRQRWHFSITAAIKDTSSVESVLDGGGKKHLSVGRKAVQRPD
jgi:hypothetical protein